MSRSLVIQQISLPTPWPPVGPVHVYLVKADPLTLIDTGLNTPESREALLAGLKSAGVAVGDIRRVLLTHAHLDHYGQAGWIQEQSGAEVWLHPDEEGKAFQPEWWSVSRRRLLDSLGVPGEAVQAMDMLWRHTRRLAVPLGPWLSLSDGLLLPFAEGALQAVHLPGHALGHTGFWEPESGVLIGGDHLLSGVTPNPIMEPVPPGHSAGVPHAPERALTLGQFFGALDKVAALPVGKVLPGHGRIITDHAAVAAGYRRRHEHRLQQLQGLLNGGMTPYEVTRGVYPRVQDFDVFLALAEVLAHLDLLVVRRQVAMDRQGGIERFCTV